MKEQYLDRHLIYDFFERLNCGGIQWVLIKNIGHELPCELKDGKDIDILVRLEDKEKFEQIMLQGGFLKRIPPLGRESGYRFGYQLPEYQFWQKADISQTFYIDACFCLMCKSLTPKFWVPLDETINRRIWENKVWDDELKCFRIGDKELLVYLLTRCVFDKHGFPEGYQAELNRLKPLLKEKEVDRMLRTVFYKCTPMVIQMVMEEKYDDILEAYIRYEDY